MKKQDRMLPHSFLWQGELLWRCQIFSAKRRHSPTRLFHAMYNDLPAPKKKKYIRNFEMKGGALCRMIFHGFKNASAFLLRDARHAKHDIFLLRISAILPEAISAGGLTPS